MPKPSLDETDLFDQAAADRARQSAQEINGAFRRVNTIHAEQTKLAAQKAQLEPWRTMDLPLDTQSTAQVTVQMGTLPPEADFDAAQGAALAAGELSELTRISGDRTAQYCLLVCHASQSEAVLAALKDVGWSRASLKEWSGTAAENLQRLDEELAALCRVYRPALLVFDPIQSYLGQGVQMNRAEQVRPLLDHLGALAKELDMAVLLISHMSKPGPGVCSALDRLLGSSDFRNAARSILIAGRDPEHPEVRVVAHAKNSLGQPGESQRYRSCPQGTVAYDGPCTLTADAIIREAGTPATGNGRPSAALANAIEALEKQLSFVGWVEAGEVYRLCAERDISVSTIRRARVALGLKTLYIGNQPNRKNYWYQPELEEASVVADITNQNQQIQLA